MRQHVSSMTAAPQRHRPVLIGLVGIAVLSALLFVALRPAGAHVLRGVALADTPAGGLDERRLRTMVETLRARASQTQVTVIPQAGGRPPVTRRDTDLGYDIDVERTVQAVLARGRQGNPLKALTDRMRARIGGIRVGPVERI